MSDTRQPPPDRRRPPTSSAAAPTPPVAGPPADGGQRQQPPLQEVLKGLDARELQSTSMFDLLFGPQAEGDARLSGRDTKR